MGLGPFDFLILNKAKIFYLHGGGDYERTHNDNGRSGYDPSLWRREDGVREERELSERREQGIRRCSTSGHPLRSREGAGVGWKGKRGALLSVLCVDPGQRMVGN